MDRTFKQLSKSRIYVLSSEIVTAAKDCAMPSSDRLEAIRRQAANSHFRYNFET